jgi:hypothetical protein
VAAVWQSSEQEARRFATRFAGQLLVLGASMGLILTLLLSVPDGTFSAGWYGNLAACLFGILWGLTFLLLPGPAPDPVLRATPALAAVLITTALAVNHSEAVNGMLLLAWPLLFAAYLLPRRNAYWTLVIVCVCLTIILVEGTGPNRFAAWVETTTSMALTLVVILRVRDQADRLKKSLAEQASTDPLTGLSNRRAFDEARGSAGPGRRCRCWRSTWTTSRRSTTPGATPPATRRWPRSAGCSPGWCAAATPSAASAARSSASCCPTARPRRPGRAPTRCALRSPRSPSTGRIR